MKPTEMKSRNELEAEWNKLAPIRNKQIGNQTDLSYQYVLKPEIINIVQSIDPSSIIDVGCGTGYLTRELTDHSSRVTAIDISERNIYYANKKLPPNTQVFVGSLNEYTDEFPDEKFELVVCNMVLQCVPELDEFLKDIKSILIDDGSFVFSITHPCFWPRYWNYEDKDWFEYKNEISIEAEFRISLDSNTQMKSTHIHRPLSKYVHELSKTGMSISKVKEPVPSKSLQEKYPEPWKFPRFLVCVTQ